MSSTAFLAVLLVSLILSALEVAVVPRLHALIVRRHARRLAARLQRGEDRHFEELRSIEAAAPEPLSAVSARPGFRTVYAFNFVRLYIAFAIVSLLRWLTDLPSDPFA
ncbi:hypothetical protein [Sphingomonas sp. G-3-2-10]|uniref:hypothetical protein n=1 Tax=Sphingomonas sp. G-3-2-10 TaxID=2728838 RepID=UPI00146A5C5C|nr:hypothetical protein [Sphingomonas sp. G-3-2-10]NML06698.1 hypothetical protein [Sphingomonas sp. G-3-2-10]